MRLDRHQICELIPHAGDMCLLHEVVSWDEQDIVCIVRNHTAADNPLRARSMLHAICGVEYAAQAMAVHGALLAQQAIASGFLASIRNLQLHVERLDDKPEVVLVTARRIMSGVDGLMYEFTLAAEDKVLMTGRATVALMHGENDVEAGADHGR